MNLLGNTLEDLLTKDELLVYHAPTYPFNLTVLSEALKKKTTENPDYEVWVPLVYYKYEPFMRKRSDVLVKPYKYFISNKGRVGHLRKKEPFIHSNWISANYWHTVVTDKGAQRLMVHRALACSFMPLGELGLSHPKDLQVNHKDGDKLNIEISNLEWATHSGNVSHAITTGLNVIASGNSNSRTKPAKGKVLRGNYKGFEFILSGRKEQLALGFIQTSINRCCLGKIREHKHCSWVFATPEEVVELGGGIPSEVLKELMEMKPMPKRPSR